MSVQCTAFRTLSWPNLALKRREEINKNVGRYIPDGVRTEMSRNLRIMRTTELSEGSHSVCLAHFKSNHRSVCQILNQGEVLRQYSLVNFVELFDYGAGQVKKLHRRNLKSSC